jgi:hypothetical protein
MLNTAPSAARPPIAARLVGGLVCHSRIERSCLAWHETEDRLWSLVGSVTQTVDSGDRQRRFRVKWGWMPYISTKLIAYRLQPDSS